MIKELRNEYYFLSNMYECPIVWKGVTFKSSETLFQMFKCKNIDDMSKFQKLNGFQAKKLGRKIEMRPDWNEVRIKYMEFVLKLKFDQNLDLRERLMRTEGKIEENNNNWNDTFWGITNGKGENHLGKLLYKLREEYIAATPEGKKLNEARRKTWNK